MLRLDEFIPAYLGEAKGLTLFLPYTGYDQTYLVTDLGGSLMAVCLDGEYAFRAFDCRGDDQAGGIMVSGITLEVDPGSAFNPGDVEPPFGALVRSKAGLGINAKPSERFYAHRTLVPLLDGLPEAAIGLRVAFRKWSIVLGSEQDRRELFKVDLPTPPAAR